MGYRNYLASLSKEEHEKIKNFNKKELNKYFGEEPDGYVGPYDIVKNNELHELGKYVEFGDEKFFFPFFENKKLQKYYNDDGEFVIVKKEFLKHIIEHYTKIVKENYQKLIDGITNENVDEIPQKKAEELYLHIRGNAIEWLQLTPYDLGREDDPSITTSWKYEYAVFELVRIYKSFDWENNVMVYYGY